ncbi:hypothetical protein T10_857 [Trichinella papuae]|uniref:Uncharacterized protein n=1 Tax=Trichinella papuae TaxID=268474 RepID=A0A0V1N5V3_9BILA|nr:hypothetical protein T10_857 [Trichinella papuae]
MFHNAVIRLSCGQTPLVKQVPSLLEAFSTSPTPSRKPLALKLGSEKHRKAALWNKQLPSSFTSSVVQSIVKLRSDNCQPPKTNDPPPSLSILQTFYGCYQDQMKCFSTVIIENE